MEGAEIASLADRNASAGAVPSFRAMMSFMQFPTTDPMLIYRTRDAIAAAAALAAAIVS